MKINTKYCIASGITGLTMVALIIADYYAKSGNCFLRFLATIAATATLIFAFTGLHHWWGEYRQERRRKSPAFTSPAIVWPLTLVLTLSLVTASPASELQAQAQQVAVSNAFKLLSANGDYEMTPTNGGPTLSFSRDCVTVDKENMLLITPTGKYKILPDPSDQSKFLLQGEDGTIYTPNVTLCVGILLAAAAAAAIAGIAYLGYKAYKCGCRVVSNYNNNLSNASSIAFSPQAVKAASQGWDGSYPMPLPPLSTLTGTDSAVHVFGPPVPALKLPANCIMTFDTNNWALTNSDGSLAGVANTNVFFFDQGDRSAPMGADIFGNTVDTRLLVVITKGNSYLVNTNTGAGVPCMFSTSTDLKNWQNMDAVSLCYSSSGAGGVRSLTAVTMTADLQPYATNWFRYENGVVVESYSLATKTGCLMYGPKQFMRLSAPVP